MIYADFNASTPLCSASRSAVEKAILEWGNPSSAHGAGRKALELLEKSRAAVANSLQSDPFEVVFTSGGSEANANALIGSYWLRPQDFRLLTSKVEHSSVRDTVELLQTLGAKVEFVPVLSNGALDMSAFEMKLASFEPHLVSLMTANNETGVLFPIPQISEMCKARGIKLHTDAVQAYGKISCAYFSGADFVSISAHKIYGPKGVGALRVKKGEQLVSTHYGGAQEVKRRGGTENVIGISGFGGAIATLSEDADCKFLEAKRNLFETNLKKGLTEISIQGESVTRIPNTSNVRFSGVPNEVLLGALDLEGICVSAGSACSSGSITPSHVLLEMGMSKAEAKECVRFSFGKPTTEEEINSLSERVIAHVTRIRNRRKAQ